MKDETDRRNRRGPSMCCNDQSPPMPRHWSLQCPGAPHGSPRRSPRSPRVTDIPPQRQARGPHPAAHGAEKVSRRQRKRGQRWLNARSCVRLQLSVTTLRRSAEAVALKRPLAFIDSRARPRRPCRTAHPRRWCRYCDRGGVRARPRPHATARSVIRPRATTTHSLSTLGNEVSGRQAARHRRHEMRDRRRLEPLHLRLFVVAAQLHRLGRVCGSASRPRLPPRTSGRPAAPGSSRCRARALRR